MRITGGSHRGRTLKVPAAARPTGARLREALFSIWCDLVHDASFLDLFAGSGAVGLEALSRGARRVLLVDRPGLGLRVLSENCRMFQEDRWRVQSADLPRDLARLGREGAWSLVFADPPYNFHDYPSLIEGVELLLARDGVLAIEHSARDDPPQHAASLVPIDRRDYGESALSFYRRG